MSAPTHDHADRLKAAGRDLEDGLGLVYIAADVEVVGELVRVDLSVGQARRLVEVLLREYERNPRR